MFSPLQDACAHHQHSPSPPGSRSILSGGTTPRHVSEAASSPRDMRDLERLWATGGRSATHGRGELAYGEASEMSMLIAIGSERHRLRYSPPPPSLAPPRYSHAIQLV